MDNFPTGRSAGRRWGQREGMYCDRAPVSVLGTQRFEKVFECMVSCRRWGG